MSINLKNEYPRTPEEFHSVVLDTVENVGVETRRKKSPVKIAVLVAAVVMLLSVTGFSADKVYNYFVKMENNKVTVDVPETTAGTTEKAPDYVKLEFGYMPEFIDPYDAPYKFSVKTQTGENAPSGLTFQLFKSDLAEKLEIFYVGSVTECMFGKNKGAILKIDTGIESDGDSYDKEFLIYFEEYGYILRCYVSERISEDEMIKIAENISLVESDKENAFIIDTYIPTIDNGGILVPSDDSLPYSEIEYYSQETEY